MAGFNGYGNNYNWGGYPGYVAPVNNWGQTVTAQPQQYVNNDYREFVHGRAGAEAYQLKPGTTMQVLWDDETDRFYVKGYDNNGRPRVLADNDFIPHVEPEVQQQTQIDTSMYATKNDIQQMINDALSNMNGYVTQNQLNQALSELAVGSGGRIVRSNEHDA